MGCACEANALRALCERLLIHYLTLAIMDTNEITRKEVIDLFQTGEFSNRRIASTLNIPRTTVNDIVNLWKETGSMRSRRTGRAPTRQKLSERTQRYLVRRSRTDPQMTARQIQEAEGGEALNVSVRHVRRVLHAHGRIARRPRPVPTHNAEHKRARLAWAMRHEHWTCEDWSKVSFKSNHC